MDGSLEALVIEREVDANVELAAERVETERDRILRAAADAAAGNVPRRDLVADAAEAEAKKTKAPTPTWAWATAAGAAASRDEILRLADEAVFGRREERDATAMTGMSQSSFDATPEMAPATAPDHSYDDAYDAVLVITPDDDIAPEAAPEDDDAEAREDDAEATEDDDAEAPEVAPEAAPELAMAIVEPPKPKSREDILREAMEAVGRDPDAEETDRDDDDDDASSAESAVRESSSRVSPRAPPPADVLAAYHRALSDDSASEGFAAATQSTRPPSPLSPLSPSPPPPPPPPPSPSPPSTPPPPLPPSPDAPPPPAPTYYRPPAMFDPLVSLPGVESDVAPLMDGSADDDGDGASLGRMDHLAVVSAYWEVHDERWRSKTRTKTAEYYRRGLHNLVRVAGRSGKSAVVYTAEGSNDCAGLEATYRRGYKQADAKDRPVDKERRPRFICVKLPLRKLHYDDWHLADHSLVENMPCAEKMRDTKLIWLNKINLVESAAHMLTLKGGARATLMEWIDADQLSELNDDAGVKRLDDVGMRWHDVPDQAGRLGDAAAGQNLHGTDAGGTPAAKTKAKTAAAASAARTSGKPPPGFKIIEGLEYSALAKEQLPEDELDGWQLRAADRVAAMTAIHPALAAGEASSSSSSALGAAGEAAATLPLADRVQIGCYAPKQRVGPCTSNFFVASRFRATLYGIAAMRQAFEDVIFDFDEEFPPPGFAGWSVQNLTWAEHFDESFDRPGYPPYGQMYAKDGFTRGKTCWSCICSTEEMIYNKMYRRNRNLFNLDRNCDLTTPYETVSKGESGVAGAGRRAPPRLGMAHLGYPEPEEAARRDRNAPRRAGGGR